MTSFELAGQFMKKRFLFVILWCSVLLIGCSKSEEKKGI